jgi:hypothetical protein
MGDIIGGTMEELYNLRDHTLTFKGIVFEPGDKIEGFEWGDIPKEYFIANGMIGGPRVEEAPPVPDLQPVHEPAAPEPEEEPDAVDT